MLFWCQIKIPTNNRRFIDVFTFLLTITYTKRIEKKIREGTKTTATFIQYFLSFVSSFQVKLTIHLETYRNKC